MKLRESLHALALALLGLISCLLYWEIRSLRIEVESLKVSRAILANSTHDLWDFQSKMITRWSDLLVHQMMQDQEKTDPIGPRIDAIIQRAKEAQP